ncbi:DNA polymerase delta, subunit 4-domain-containing protein [Durotheca rogersii]|uniref:DNA polymerase delta, subunit 4-domain-containing protein n=1 Tax=Durotheca rogersii TaxID=419775 RepID=UPI0022201956|nr:DNA polymerase delta, subunit 4-domain-containing protein [Durotheca rogersii]KAI5864415.1 DNA polymerase delta, subunit 4-domain-containing protein [Durotheca rogersii]
MPPPPRRASARSAGSAGKQSTLSFHHRVTKTGASQGGKKAAAAAPPASTRSTPPVVAPPASPPAAAAREPQEEDERELKEREEAVPPQAADAVRRARALAPRQIDAYWRALEQARGARRVHQEGLDVGEKVLRYWDVSSQYGPCVGMTRTKRWLRAHRLGLDPPLEVLAVLLREEEAPAAETAHMDEILNSTAVGAI